MILPNLFQLRPSAGFLSLLRNGVEAGVEERGQNQDRHDAGKQAGALGSGLAAASAGDLGEHGHGVVRRAGEQRDAHGEQHAAEQSLGQEGLKLGGRAGTAEVEEDDVGCKAERDQRREQVNVGAQDGVELDGAQPLKTGRLPNISDTRVEIAIASHGHRMPLPRAKSHPVM